MVFDDKVKGRFKKNLNKIIKMCTVWIFNNSILIEFINAFEVSIKCIPSYCTPQLLVNYLCTWDWSVYGMCTSYNQYKFVSNIIIIKNRDYFEWFIEYLKNNYTNFK